MWPEQEDIPICLGVYYQPWINLHLINLWLFTVCVGLRKTLTCHPVEQFGSSMIVLNQPNSNKINAKQMIQIKWLLVFFHVEHSRWSPDMAFCWFHIQPQLEYLTLIHRGQNLSVLCKILLKVIMIHYFSNCIFGAGGKTHQMGPWCTFVFPLQRFQAVGARRRHLYSRSEILATDECSRAAHISRVVQTSKQAATAAGGGAEMLCK